MAITVGAVNTRIAQATIASDTGTWGNDGGGGGVSDEPDIVYQGSTAQSRKVSTSVIGRSYTHGSGTDMDGTPASTAHWIAKVNATNSAALLTRTSPALHVKIGSSSSAYHTYYLYGSDNYPPRGGWQIIAIAPSVAGYASAVGDTGSPNDSSILYWSILGDFSATSKSENLCIDAIDVGLGLYLYGNTPDGVFDDFVSHDEGTSGNRYGYVYTEGPAIYVTGQLAIGQDGTPSAQATAFTDSDVTLIWTNGLVTSGFHRLLFDLGGTGTDISLTRCTLISTGQSRNNGDRGYTTTEDSRTVFEVTGTTGVLSLESCNIQNFSETTLNSKCTLTDCVISNSAEIFANTAVLTGTSVLESAAAADGFALTWNTATDPDGYLDDMVFSKGAAAHHAINFGTSSPTSITLNNIDFIGFNASDSVNDSTFYFTESSGAVTYTLNLVGCTGNFSVKSAGAVVNVVINPVQFRVSVKDIDTGAAIQNARVFVAVADGTNFPFEDTVTATSSGTTATITHTAHGLATNDYVLIEGANEAPYNGAFQITVTGANTYTYTMSSSTTSPATGTLISTFCYFNTLTNVSGIVSDTRSIAADQDIVGRVRKSSSSPYYVSSPITGTIDSANGLSLLVQMISDE